MIPGIMIPGTTDRITTVHTTIIVPVTITHIITTRLPVQVLLPAESIPSDPTVESMMVDGTGISAAVLLQAVQPHSVQVQAVASILAQA